MEYLAYKTVAGLTFRFLSPSKNSACYSCKSNHVPLLYFPESPRFDNSPEERNSSYIKEAIGLCEPCTLLSSWTWQTLRGGAIHPPFPTTPWASLVLIATDRPSDFQFPYDVLMVGRKDEPGSFGLPGGKSESYNEPPVQTAIRELQEETSLVTWPAALETLYTAYSPRGRLVRVFLCRAYAGNVPAEQEEQPIVWKKWPPSQHTASMRGFYLGLEESFRLREKLQRTSESRAGIANPNPLSMKLGPSAMAYLELVLKKSHGVALTGEESQHFAKFEVLTTPMEKIAVELIKARDKAALDEAALTARDMKTMAMVDEMGKRDVAEAAGGEETAGDEPDENGVGS